MRRTAQHNKVIKKVAKKLNISEERADENFESLFRVIYNRFNNFEDNNKTIWYLGRIFKFQLLKYRLTHRIKVEKTKQEPDMSYLNKLEKQLKLINE